MLCPSCGTNVGDAVALCANCEQLQPPEPVEDEVQVQEPTREGLCAASALTPMDVPTWALYAMGGTLFFLCLWLASILAHPENAVGQSLLLSIIALVFSVGFAAYIILWLELLRIQFVIALVTLLIPLSMFPMIFVYWEEVRRTAIVWLAANILTLLLYWLFFSLYGSNPFFLMKEMFG